MNNHFGQPIQVGDELIHVANRDGSICTRRVEVLEVRETSVRVKYLTAEFGTYGVGREATLTSAQRLFPIPEGL